MVVVRSKISVFQIDQTRPRVIEDSLPLAVVIFAFESPGANPTTFEFTAVTPAL
jgi:hypothetical protein